jgi:hypothetical protein
MIIEFKNTVEKRVLEPGDMIQAFDGEDSRLFLFITDDADHGQSFLVDLGNSELYHGAFNHPIHVINHIKKNYASHVLIKAEDIKLSINNKI